MKKHLSAFGGGFTLVELLVSITIIGILASIGLSTFTSAQMKSRDAKRKSNLDQISRALEMYFNDYKEYPDSDLDAGFVITGNIKGCGAAAAETCTWGTSVFSNTSVTPNTVYMVLLPKDPVSDYTYHYESLDLGKKYQLYARLENTQDISVHKNSGGQAMIYFSSTADFVCGTKHCNYGVSSSNTTPESDRTLITE